MPSCASCPAALVCTAPALRAPWSTVTFRDKWQTPMRAVQERFKKEQEFIAREQAREKEARKEAYQKEQARARRFLQRPHSAAAYCLGCT